MKLLSKLRSQVLLFGLIGMLVLVGCTTTEQAFYKRSPVNNALEIPPNLVKAKLDESFSIPIVGGLVTQKVLLSSNATVSMHREGGLRWLEISEPTNKVWDYVAAYWESNKIPLLWENKKLGIMQTDWIDNYESEFLRDRFRIRIEIGKKPGTSLLFLTHQGVQRDFYQDDIVNVWEPRTHDKELEIEVLGQLLEYFALEPQRVKELVAQAKKQKPGSTLQLKDSPPSLIVHDTKDKAWDFTAAAIDRMGHLIIERDELEGILTIRVSEDEFATDFSIGLVGAFTQQESFKLKFSVVAEKETKITVLDDEFVEEDSQQARNILIRIKDNL